MGTLFQTFLFVAVQKLSSLQGMDKEGICPSYDSSVYHLAQQKKTPFSVD